MCFKQISSFKGVMCYMEVSKLFQQCFKGPPRKFHGYFKGVSGKILGCLKSASWGMKGTYISKPVQPISRKFQRRLIKVSRMFH